MSAEDVCAYYQCIPMLEAQERLAQLTVADWPNMKKHKREELHRKLHKTAYPETYSRGVSVTQLAKIVGLGKL